MNPTELRSILNSSSELELRCLRHLLLRGTSLSRSERAMSALELCELFELSALELVPALNGLKNRAKSLSLRVIDGLLYLILEVA